MPIYFVQQFYDTFAFLFIEQQTPFVSGLLCVLRDCGNFKHEVVHFANGDTRGAIAGDLYCSTQNTHFACKLFGVGALARQYRFRLRPEEQI